MMLIVNGFNNMKYFESMKCIISIHSHKFSDRFIYNRSCVVMNLIQLSINWQQLDTFGYGAKTSIEKPNKF